MLPVRRLLLLASAVDYGCGEAAAVTYVPAHTSRRLGTRAPLAANHASPSGLAATGCD